MPTSKTAAETSLGVNLGSTREIEQPDLKLALTTAHREYTSKNPESKRLFEKSLSSLPGGNTRTVIHAHPFPLAFHQGEGNTLFTVDGGSYIDFLNEYSAGIYGHSSKTIKYAITAALDKGWNFGGNTVLEKRLAMIVTERFKLERVRFTNSGTEATLMAVGAAINFTGRKKVREYFTHINSITMLMLIAPRFWSSQMGIMAAYSHSRASHLNIA